MSISEQQLKEIMDKTMRDVSQQLEAEHVSMLARIAPHMTALKPLVQSFFPSVRVVSSSSDAAATSSDNTFNITR